MTQIETYRKKFTEKALRNGYSAENITKCLDYAIPIKEKNLPIIYNATHFSQLVGYNLNYIGRSILFTSYFYRKFSIKKKNGKERILFEPLPSLKEIQDWILLEILYKIPISRYAKAYVPKRSLKEHTIYHTDEDIVITLDIIDFFKTIKFETVEKIYFDLGYSKRVSNLLTRICFLDKELPQGAPTSPCISNIVLKSFDLAMGNYCLENKIKYTRYADDLAFSGDLNKINTEEIIAKVKKELNELGFSLNEVKTKIMKRNDPQLISGIIVNKKPQVPRRIRNKLRNEMFYIKTFGLEDHVSFP